MENERNVAVKVVETCVVVLRDDTTQDDTKDDTAFLYADDTKRDTAFLFIFVFFVFFVFFFFF